MRMMVWAVASALLLVLPATAATANSATIEVTARLQHHNYAALSPAGRGGDAESSRWIVYDRHNRSVGDMLFDCRWVTADLRLCTGQLAMPLGSLAVLGSSRTRFLGQLAVVGGTGHYIGANGTLLFNATNNRRYVLSINYQEGQE